MRCSLWVNCLAGLLLWGGQLESSQAEGLPAYSLGYDSARDPFSDGRAALQLARQTDRMVLIEVHERFVVLKVNVDDNTDNAEFLSAFPPALGYPHLYITSNDGSIVHSQDTAEFLQNGKYSQQRVLDFLEHWGLQDE